MKHIARKRWQNKRFDKNECVDLQKSHFRVIFAVCYMDLSEL